MTPTKAPTQRARSILKLSGVCICDAVSVTKMTGVISVFLKSNLLYIISFVKVSFKTRVGRRLYTCKLKNVKCSAGGHDRAVQAECREQGRKRPVLPFPEVPSVCSCGVYTDDKPNQQS